MVSRDTALVDVEAAFGIIFIIQENAAIAGGRILEFRRRRNDIAQSNSDRHIAWILNLFFQLYERSLLITAEAIAGGRIEIKTVHRHRLVASVRHDRSPFGVEDDGVAVELEIVGGVGNLDLGKVPDERDIAEETQGFVIRLIASI